MDRKNELKRMIIGNLVLTQLQAIVVGFLAALVSIGISWVPQGSINLKHALVLCSSSTSTASIASLVLGICHSMNIDTIRSYSDLGIIMILVIALSHKCRINPDNIATPIAASLGDLTTLAVLAGIGGFLFRMIGTITFDK
jgi:solute carrier family 41